MPGIGDDQTRRILEGFYALVESRVQAKLPASKRGLRSTDLVRSRIPGAVENALEGLTRLIAEKVNEELGEAAEQNPRASLEGRFKVLDNKKPCDACRKTRPVAVLEIRAGVVVSVECEACSPSFGQDPIHELES